MKRKESKIDRWNFCIFLVLLIGLLIYFSINYYEKNINIKSCDFVCNHLNKIKRNKSVYYLIQHPVFEYLKNRTPSLQNVNSEGVGEMAIPINSNTNEPYYCPCKFKLVYCPELGGKLPHIFDRCEVKEIIVFLNYTSWKEWWLKS